MATQAQKNSAILVLRQAVSNIINGVNQINAIATEDAATGIVESLVDADFIGDNEGLTAAQFQAALKGLAAVLADVRDTNKNPDLAKSIYAIKF